MSGFCDSAYAEFCAESATLRRIWGPVRIVENLPNGAENVKILLIFLTLFLTTVKITQYTTLC